MKSDNAKKPTADLSKKKRRSNRHFKVTRLGWYFFALTLGVGLAALRTGNNLLFLVLGMMLGMVLLSGITAELSLRGLELTRYPPSRLFACKPFLMGIGVRNRKRYLPSFSIEVEDILESRLMDKRCYFLKIPSGRRQVTSYRHAFPRRGKYKFKGFRVSTKFPFGLLRKSVDLEVRGEVVVYPSLRKVPMPHLGGLMLDDPRVEARLQRHGDPFGLRDYRPGDDPRQIHHKASAHLGRTVVRECEDGSARRALLYLDNTLNLLPNEGYLSCAEGLEHAVSTTASLASRLIEHNIEVSVVTRSGAVPYGGGQPHLLSVLRFLAVLGYDVGTARLNLNRHATSDMALVVTRYGYHPIGQSGVPVQPHFPDPHIGTGPDGGNREPAASGASDEGA